MISWIEGNEASGGIDIQSSNLTELPLVFFNYNVFIHLHGTRVQGLLVDLSFALCFNVMLEWMLISQPYTKGTALAPRRLFSSVPFLFTEATPSQSDDRKLLSMCFYLTRVNPRQITDYGHHYRNGIDTEERSKTHQM